MGTLINVATIVVGGMLGLILGSRLSDRIRVTIVYALGLFTFAYGLQMFMKTQNSLIVLISLLIGVILGEWWQIEKRLENVGVWIESKINHGKTAEGANSRFVLGFLTASLVFCVGPMAILGAFQDGLTGDYGTLAVKAIIDGFTAMAFASSLGVGVIFSVLPVLVYQGGLTLLATQIQTVVTEPMMLEMSAAGGIILMAIAFSSLLEIKKIRAGNFLPALVIAPILVAIASATGLY